MHADRVSSRLGGRSAGRRHEPRRGVRATVFSARLGTRQSGGPRAAGRARGPARRTEPASAGSGSASRTGARMPTTPRSARAGSCAVTSSTRPTRPTRRGSWTAPPGRYNPFHVVLADASGFLVESEDGRASARRLPPGCHIVSSNRPFDESPREPKVARAWRQLYGMGLWPVRRGAAAPATSKPGSRRSRRPRKRGPGRDLPARRPLRHAERGRLARGPGRVLGRSGAHGPRVRLSWPAVLDGVCCDRVTAAAR